MGCSPELWVEEIPPNPPFQRGGMAGREKGRSDARDCGPVCDSGEERLFIISEIVRENLPLSPKMRTTGPELPP
jgi:hypothetical protein